MAWTSAIIGKQVIGFPGSEVLSVTPTVDYLIHGPVGDGWYDQREQRYVTTDYHVVVRLEDGREITLPKSYRWVADGTGTCERKASA